MYKVINQFRDRDGKIYEVDDVYENENTERIEELSTDKNRYGFPFIEKEVKKRTRNKKED